MEGSLHQSSPVVQGALIFLIITNVLTLPFTAVLNGLVMFAVKNKPRLRAHKSNIVIAFLASTDFAVGVFVQPLSIVMLITILLGSAKVESTFAKYLTVVMSCLLNTSLLHLALISGERYLAMKQPFLYITLVTEARLLLASAFAWILSVIMHIPGFIDIDPIVFLYFNNAFVALFIAFIVFCHVTVFRETRRHEKQIAVQQAKQEKREQFLKDRKAFKLTTIIVVVLLLCYIPFVVCRMIVVFYLSELSLETVHIVFSLALSTGLLNSFLNPIIYAASLKQFRVAFIELACGTRNIVEAEEIEMRSLNAVVRLQVGK